VASDEWRAARKKDNEETQSSQRIQKTVTSEKVRLRLRLAAIGLAVSAILYAGYALVPYSKDRNVAMLVLGAISCVFCPPSLALVDPLAIYEPYYQVGGNTIGWLIVGLINAVLYATVGHAVARFLSKARRAPAN
jgi:hypothetical protein